ncbi:MAG: ATP-binding protein, partial [Bacteroidota bacterium]
KIFEPFYTTKPVGEGTGLGLWVSLGIAKSFQGDISMESQVNKGSTFTVTLPMK